MTNQRESTPEINRDDPMIAAEWSLGLLEGEELIAARGKHAADPDFAWRKEWWDNWFAPLADEIAPAEPSPQVWERISESVNAPAPADQVTGLRPRAAAWRWVGAITAAAAAVALIFTFAPPQGPSPAPLVATVPIGDTGLRLDVTYLPESATVQVGAEGLIADGVHDHQLWVVPPDGGALASLGVITPGEARSLTIPAQTAAHLRAGARLLLTREPLGGKPAGTSAGPVVAEGDFAPAP